VPKNSPNTKAPNGEFSHQLETQEDSEFLFSEEIKILIIEVVAKAKGGLLKKRRLNVINKY